MTAELASPLKIAIIGAGFSGTALAANLIRYSSKPCEITLIDKRGVFGLGEAYSTGYHYHLLNVRAYDMSAFEEEPNHFVDWLQTITYPPNQLDQDLPLPTRFVPRMLYGKYLQTLLKAIPNLFCVHNEVIDIVKTEQGAQLIMQDGKTLFADKVILALGNGTPNPFPFPISHETHCIHNPWDSTAITSIPKQEPVLILGTGLSMIDVVLSLHHHQHKGMIYALSRHGLLPLPHTENHLPNYLLQLNEPKKCHALSKKIHAQAKKWMQEGGDWRAIMQSLRLQMPELWMMSDTKNKKQFLRHILPYWNIHRHRVHQKLFALLTEKSRESQLKVIAGRVLQVENGLATIRLRHSTDKINVKTNWLVNCMGPPQRIIDQKYPLIKALTERGLVSFDSLKLGFSITACGAVIENSGKSSPFLFALGPPTKGTCWETSAVPDIRKQCLTLAKYLARLRKGKSKWNQGKQFQEIVI